MPDVLSPFAARRSSWRHHSLAAAQARRFDLHVDTISWSGAPAN